MRRSRPDVEDLVEISRLRARAEAAEWMSMLRFREGERARVASLDSAMKRLIEESAIAVVIGQALGLSEGQVVGRLAAADRVIECAPKTWAAFLAGQVDAARVREIALTVGRLERPESWQRLDNTVLAYAVAHTVAQLRQWLRRFVARVEADLTAERAQAECEKRHVTITHTEDSMAWVNAYLPSHQAAVIHSRLRREARAASADGRTLEQREADVFAAMLTGGMDAGGSAGPRIDIAVTLDARTLTGATDGFAESADGAWEVPAQWVLDSALVGESFWHRLLVDPIVGDTLAHEYVGYATPDVLRRAIVLRDGVCAGLGCLRPAASCDMDHREPWPIGATTGSNLDPRCRADHSRKGHGALQRILHAHHARTRPKTRARYRQPDAEPSERETVLARALGDVQSVYVT